MIDKTAQTSNIVPESAQLTQNRKKCYPVRGDSVALNDVTTMKQYFCYCHRVSSVLSGVPLFFCGVTCNAFSDLRCLMQILHEYIGAVSLSLCVLHNLQRVLVASREG